MDETEYELVVTRTLDIIDRWRVDVWEIHRRPATSYVERRPAGITRRGFTKRGAIASANDAIAERKNYYRQLEDAEVIAVS